MHVAKLHNSQTADGIILRARGLSIHKKRRNDSKMPGCSYRGNVARKPFSKEWLVRPQKAAFRLRDSQKANHSNLSRRTVLFFNSIAWDKTAVDEYEAR